MSRNPLIVLADDLTGAAEIAAIAHQAGLTAVVHTTFPSGRVAADVVVINTDTRLLPPARAAAAVAKIAQRLRRRPSSAYFKKTDSVLRGPVLVEIEACAAALGYRRTLLVPCNPSLGRVIRDGRYYLGGLPLHKTAFVRDPHHPRTTSDVLGLLGVSSPAPAAGTKPARPANSSVTCCVPAVRLPDTGIIVGEADTPADVSFWAGQVNTHTLPAGGADFFRAWLQTRRLARTAVAISALPEGPTVLLSGTATPPEPISPLPGPLVEINPRRLPLTQATVVRLQTELRNHGSVGVAMRRGLVRNPRTPVLINRYFTGLAGALHRARAFRHLIIAGGATAASVLEELGWTKLRVVRVWGPGVVTLQPAGSRSVVTMKPGSYAWPATLSRHFEGSPSPLETAAR